MAVLFSLGIIVGTWFLSHFIFGGSLVPSPIDTIISLFEMICTQNFFIHLSITLFRGIMALGLTTIASLILGIGAGRTPKIMDLISPLVACLQATPPILWVTLVMVWAGTGNVVPILVVFASLFPPLFMTIATATASLDPRYFHLSKIYKIPRKVVLFEVIWPGIFPHFTGGFSYALGSCLKVAAVAEFLGADRGIGARIYWAYRMMEMENLFAWALVLVGLGVGLDFFLIRPLRTQLHFNGGINADS